MIQNNFKLQWSAFIFLNTVFHAFVFASSLCVCSTLYSGYGHINFQWFFHFSEDLFLMETALGCNQSKWLWHSFACSVAPEDAKLTLMPSCWCSVDLLMALFLFQHYIFTSIYILICTLQGSYLVLTYLFLHIIFFK